MYVVIGVGRVKLLKKWREFLEGGNDIWVFLQKGKHHCRADGPAGQMGLPGRWASGQMAWQMAGQTAGLNK